MFSVLCCFGTPLIFYLNIQCLPDPIPADRRLSYLSFRSTILPPVFLKISMSVRLGSDESLHLPESIRLLLPDYTRRADRQNRLNFLHISNNHKFQYSWHTKSNPDVRLSSQILRSIPNYDRVRTHNYDPRHKITSAADHILYPKTDPNVPSVVPYDDR